MSISKISKKTLAFAAAAALTVSVAPFAVPTANASTTSTTINSSCRTNGAPMKYNVTRPQTAQVVIDAPDQVKAGENFVVRATVKPEMIPGKESIATMKEVRDVVLRFTLDNPSSFVTARLVGAGQNIAGNPKISLVGGNMLVVSGFVVTVNGKNTNWVTPTMELTFKAPQNAKSVPTFHPAVEGAAGEFNNPANYFTSKPVTDSILGELVIQLNCQSLAGAGTLRSIPVVGGGAKADKSKKDSKAKKDAKSKKDSKAKKDAKSKKDSKATTSSNASSDANGLEIVDEDNTVDEENMESSTPAGLIAGIVIAVLIVAGGIGYGVYRGVKKKKGEES